MSSLTFTLGPYSLLSPERRSLENAGRKGGFVTFVLSRFWAVLGTKAPPGIIRAVPGVDGT